MKEDWKRTFDPNVTGSLADIWKSYWKEYLVIFFVGLLAGVLVNGLILLSVRRISASAEYKRQHPSEQRSDNRSEDSNVGGEAHGADVLPDQANLPFVLSPYTLRASWRVLGLPKRQVLVAHLREGVWVEVLKGFLFPLPLDAFERMFDQRVHGVSFRG